MSKNKSKEFFHRFLDEAGDTTFFGKGKVPFVGKVEGVSLSFILGMVKFKEPLMSIREKIIELQKEIEIDEYLNADHYCQHILLLEILLHCSQET